MARVKLTEYRAKKIILGGGYAGVSIHGGEKPKLPKGEKRWVAKVDQGVKKRFKQGLVVVDKTPAECLKAIALWRKKGYSRFLMEPYMPHDPKEEQYLSLERVREGIRILHAAEGGVDIEAHPERVKTHVVAASSEAEKAARATKLPATFLKNLIERFDEDFFAFLELNPLVVRGGFAVPLDAAVLVDSAGVYFTRAWSEDDLVEPLAKHPRERRVEDLGKTTPASLRLSILNPDGALFFLLSGGGGSIVIADQAELRGAGGLIGNYGEYSGGPTREETYLYAKEIVGLMLDSKRKKKALVIAGGVANFTDVRKTFQGIIDALSEAAPKLRRAGVKVFIRRGGPHEAEGLALMEEFLRREGLFGAVHGSDAVITRAVDDAIDFLRV